MNRDDSCGYSFVELLTVIALVSLLSSWFLYAAKDVYRAYMAHLSILQAQSDTYYLNLIRRSTDLTSLPFSGGKADLISRFPEMTRLILFIGSGGDFADYQLGESFYTINKDRVEVVVDHSVEASSSDVNYFAAVTMATADGEGEPITRIRISHRESDPGIYLYVNKALSEKQVVGY